MDLVQAGLQPAWPINTQFWERHLCFVISQGSLYRQAGGSHTGKACLWDLSLSLLPAHGIRLSEYFSVMTLGLGTRQKD